MIDNNQILSILNSIENITLLSDVSMSESDLPVYTILTPLSPASDKKAIIKILSEDQAVLYQHLSKINNPFLEKIYDVEFTDNIYYSINEYIPRPDCFDYKLFDACNTDSNESLSLYQYISNYHFFEKQPDGVHFLDEKTALIHTLELIEGLEALHSEGFVHGDLSPQNILLTNPVKMRIKSNKINKADIKYSFKIIDYGTLRPLKPDNHPVTKVAGTKEFTAPEILAYNIPNDRIDIFSLGCLLHYMCLGVSPTENGIDYASASLSSGMLNIIKNCTNEYSTRYQSLNQLKKAILREIKLPEGTAYKFISHLPGFRTNRLWKKVIASFYYLWLIMDILITVLMCDFRYSTWLFIGLCIAWAIFVPDAPGIGKRVLWYANLTKKHKSIKYITKFLIFFLLLVIYWILWYM